MKYLKYVPPHIVAKEAREALAKRKETPEQRIQRMQRIGLIKILEDGTVKVCIEPEPEDNGEQQTPR